MQVENNFEELHIFEDKDMNKVCDALFNFVKKHSGEEISICGSIARIFSDKLPSIYKPKDVDFVVSKSAFVQLTRMKINMNNIVTIEKQPNRLIFYTLGSACVELWAFDSEDENKVKKYYKNKISYLI